MTQLLSEHGRPAKLLGSLPLKVRVAAGSTAVLIAGALLAPRSTPTAVPASEERVVPLLEQEVQRREPSRLFRPVQDIARQIVVHNVTIPPPLHSYPRTVPDMPGSPATSVSPAGFGLFVDENGTVLTHASALLGQSSLRLLTADGASIEAQVVAHEASTGLVLLRTSGANLVLPAALETTRVEAGSLAATAAKWMDRTLVAPVFVTSAGERSYAIDAHGAALAGMPLYNLDGRAFAIATGSTEGTAYPAREAFERLAARRASGKAMDAALGMTFQALTASLLRVFQANGALVTSVAANGPAGAAGIVHGDVVTAIGNTGVDSPEAAQKAIAALAPGETIAVEVLRGARTLTLTATAGSAFDFSRPAPRRLSEGSVSPHDVLSRQEIESMAISDTAAILEINGRPVNSRAEALREWRRARDPKLLYLDHDGIRFFAVVGDAP
jgi:S1-C subfamily serine protease